jgi:hypothetical protein
MTDALTKLYEIETRLKAAQAAEKAALARLASVNRGGRLDLAEFNMRLMAAKDARRAADKIQAEWQAHVQRFYRKA